jgi:hypothetical protein
MRLWFEKGGRTRKRRENTFFFLPKRASVFTFARPRAALLVKKGGHNHNLSLPITKTTKALRGSPAGVLVRGGLYLVK